MSAYEEPLDLAVAAAGNEKVRNMASADRIFVNMMRLQRNLEVNRKDLNLVQGFRLRVRSEIRSHLRRASEDIFQAENSRSNERLKSRAEKTQQNADVMVDVSKDDCESPKQDSNAHVQMRCSEVPYPENVLYFLPENYNKRNPWRRMSGFHGSGHELQSSTYPARTSVRKLRFAQAKKPLNYLYSYFSIHILDCDAEPNFVIGLTRKDYSSKVEPGRVAGSVGYFSDTGLIYLRDNLQITGPTYSQGDVIGCGIVYPPHYKRYAELSTDDNSDGMSDVVLTSLLNKKSMDFVTNVLNLNVQRNSSIDADYEEEELDVGTETNDYYNENFVESRTQVEVYFTYNMQVIGKILTHIPIGGFYPTIHVFSSSAVKLNVDLNPPSS